MRREGFKALVRNLSQRTRFWRTLGILAFVSLLYLTLQTFSRSAAQGNPPEVVLQTGHSSRVNCAVFGPNHKWLASGGADNTVRIWDVDSGLELRALPGHKSWIKSIAVSRNGDRLASASTDHTVKVWDVLTGREVLTLDHHQSAVEVVRFSPDDKWLVSGTSDGAIRIWDAASGQEIKLLNGDSTAVTALAFSGDGQVLASGRSDNRIKLWDTKTWEQLHSLDKHTSRITALTFSQDNRSLLSGSANGGIMLWDLRSGKNRLSVNHGSAAVLAMAFISEGEFLSTTADGTIVSWDASSAKEKRVLAGDTSSGELLFSTLSGDGGLLASSKGDRLVQIRNAIDGKINRTLASHSTAFFSVALSPDGQWLAGGTNDRTVRIWQVTTGREMPKLAGQSGWVNTVAFSPDSTLLASGSNSGEVKIWDVTTGRNLYSEPHSQEIIHAVAFSSDGKWLAAAGTGKTVYLLEVASRRGLKLTGHASEITSLAFIGHSSLLASGSTDKTIRLWDVNTGGTVKTLTNLTDQVNSVAVSQDGKTLAAGMADNNIALFHLSGSEAGQPQILSGHTGEVFTLAFSRDEKLLASGGADGTVRLWEPQTGKEVRTSKSSTGDVNGLDFSNDSRTLVSADGDGSLIVWDTDTGKSVGNLVSMPESDDWLVVSPTGLFDGSPTAWNQILWRFNNTFDHAPVEAFFNEYYYPGLLADIFAGKKLNAPSDISQKDRRQIPLTLTTVGQPTSDLLTSTTQEIQVQIEESSAGTDISDKNKQLPPSGARDVRLFRNGSLVKLWLGDAFALGEKEGCKLQPQATPQAARRTICKTNVSIVAGSNNFTAYAFNGDNIKSRDAALTLTGAESLKRAGTLYVLSVGVNEYQNKAFNLTYAVPDAEDFGTELQKQQRKLKNYERTEIIPLFNERAKKQSILSAMTELANKVRPEDAVVVYFAGHGTIGSCLTEGSKKVNARDRFYLVPYDLGYQGEIPERCEQSLLDIVAGNSISDLELARAFEKIDAGQLLLVIDACNSGQALESEEKRRGPMNSKGLAQLAYEKGMYVLTAALSFQEAKADKKIAKGHGYLTYALIEEALREKKAADKDGNVLLRDWVDYAAQRVPRMQQAETIERRQFVKKQADKGSNDQDEVQTPRVFYRREPDLNPFVVARP